MTFIDDAHVHAIGTATYAATLAPTWRSMLDIHGGYVAALTTRAIELAVDDPTRALRNITVQFIRPASAGDITIDVETVRSGRSVSFLRAAVAQDERPVLTASAVAATTRDGFEFCEIQPPAIPSHRPAESARFTGPEPGLHFTQLDLTLEPGLSIFGNHDRARAAGWIGPREPDTRITVPWLVCAADFIPPTMDFRTDHPSGAATIELAVQLM